MKIQNYKTDELVPYEHNPRINDVIIDRWEKQTGQKAVLLDD